MTQNTPNPEERAVADLRALYNDLTPGCIEKAPLDSHAHAVQRAIGLLSTPRPSEQAQGEVERIKAEIIYCTRLPLRNRVKGLLASLSPPSSGVPDVLRELSEKAPPTEATMLTTGEVAARTHFEKASAKYVRSLIASSQSGGGGNVEG